MENNEQIIEAVEEKPANTGAFSDVVMHNADEPVRVEPAKEEVVIAPELEALTKELNEWKEKATQLESREPVKEVVYQLPEDYVSIMEDPVNREFLNIDIDNIPVLDLYKQVLQREKPWLKTDAALENEIKKQFPDAEFDIPENLGLPEDEWGEIMFKADGERDIILQHKADLQARIEAAKQNALQAKTQAPTSISVEEQINLLTAQFNEGLAGKKSPTIDVSIEGFQIPTVSDAELKEMFESGNAIFKVDPEKGFVTDVQAMHDSLLSKKIFESLKPMVDAAKRIAPKEAREALEASIANKTLHNKDNGGVRSEDPNAKQQFVSPYSDVRNLQN